MVAFRDDGRRQDARSAAMVSELGYYDVISGDIDLDDLCGSLRTARSGRWQVNQGVFWSCVSPLWLWCE